ncbi:MAG: hypothetical protein AB7S63_11085, partial [Thauera sp.]
ETPAQHACLADNGCDGFQGYLFARPEAEAAFAARLEEPDHARQTSAGSSPAHSAPLISATT